jgi:hypothetical protein
MSPSVTVLAYWLPSGVLLRGQSHQCRRVKARIELALGDNSFRTGVSNQPLGGNDLCHHSDTEAEVNRMTQQGRCRLAMFGM